MSETENPPAEDYGVGESFGAGESFLESEDCTFLEAWVPASEIDSLTHIVNAMRVEVGVWNNDIVVSPGPILQRGPHAGGAVISVADDDAAVGVGIMSIGGRFVLSIPARPAASTKPQTAASVVAGETGSKDSAPTMVSYTVTVGHAGWLRAKGMGLSTSRNFTMKAAGRFGFRCSHVRVARWFAEAADSANTESNLTSIRHMLPFFVGAVFTSARNAAGAPLPGILNVCIGASDTTVDSAAMPVAFCFKDLEFYIVKNEKDFSRMKCGVCLTGINGAGIFGRIHGPDSVIVRHDGSLQLVCAHNAANRSVAPAGPVAQPGATPPGGHSQAGRDGGRGGGGGGFGAGAGRAGTELRDMLGLASGSSPSPAAVLEDIARLGVADALSGLFVAEPKCVALTLHLMEDNTSQEAPASALLVQLPDFSPLSKLCDALLEKVPPVTAASLL